MMRPKDARKVLKAHKKVAKGVVKVHKKAGKAFYKGHKAAAKFGMKVAKGAIKKPGKAAAAIASGGISLVAKKLFGKGNNTNVTKATKAQREERIDKSAAKHNKGKGRTDKQQAKVDARRKIKDAKDAKRMGENEGARTRVNKQITKRNERLGRSDETYKAKKVGRKGAPGGKRGQGAGRVDKKKAAKLKIAKLREIFKNRKANR